MIMIISIVSDQTIVEEMVKKRVVHAERYGIRSTSSISVFATSSNQTLITDGALSITGSGENRQILLSPLADRHGVSEISIYANDGVNNVTQRFMVNVTAVNDVPSGEVLLSGEPFVGSILSTTSQVTDKDGIDEALTWRWLRDGQVITGATNPSLTLSQADVGAQIAVEVSYTDKDGTAESVVSTPSEVVTIPVIEVVMSELSLDTTDVLLGSAPILSFQLPTCHAMLILLSRKPCL